MFLDLDSSYATQLKQPPNKSPNNLLQSFFLKAVQGVDISNIER